MIYKYYLSLGSNISPRMFYMKQALVELEKIGIIKEKSSVYESEPWGKKDQPCFLNAIISLHTLLKPFKLLYYIKEIEKYLGRKYYERWGPREIDIDIIFCENIYIKHQNLNIPHENFQQRKFVLMPMMELNRDYNIEGMEMTVETVLSKCPDLSSIKQINVPW